MSRRDPFDDDFFQDTGPSAGQAAGFGVVAGLMGLVSIVLTLAFYGALIAVIAYVVLFMLEMFDVLAVNGVFL